MLPQHVAIFDEVLRVVSLQRTMRRSTNKKREKERAKELTESDKSNKTIMIKNSSLFLPFSLPLVLSSPNLDGGNPVDSGVWAGPVAAALVETNNAVEFRVKEPAGVLAAPSARPAMEEQRRGPSRVSRDFPVKLVAIANCKEARLERLNGGVELPRVRDEWRLRHFSETHRLVVRERDPLLLFFASHAFMMYL
jgi:hypothetical protein